ncbi:hypothetical protein FA15DRAFT_661803 [Coprinopsis marcescibilis]|uniref:Uncharacterized protein n=1 Tax=Coprinopsis marcescibilis TaxID=230819 RepID=A0A5C3KB25_COPMA|nr:hypothetical protein FA15DRAFT_661803 [Coprinopsis marcescibilis]
MYQVLLLATLLAQNVHIERFRSELAFVKPLCLLQQRFDAYLYQIVISDPTCNLDQAVLAWYIGRRRGFHAIAITSAGNHQHCVPDLAVQCFARRRQVGLPLSMMSAPLSLSLRNDWLWSFQSLGFDIHTYLARMLVQDYTDEALARLEAANVEIERNDKKNLRLTIFGDHALALFHEIHRNFRLRFCHCDRSYQHRSPFRPAFSHLTFANVTRLGISVNDDAESNTNLGPALGCLGLIELQIVFSSYLIAELMAQWPVLQNLQELKMGFDPESDDIPCWYWEECSCDCKKQCVTDHGPEEQVRQDEEVEEANDDGSSSEDGDKISKCGCPRYMLKYQHDVSEFAEYPWETDLFWKAFQRFPKLRSFRLETEYSLKVDERITTRSSSAELLNLVHDASATVTHVAFKSNIEAHEMGFGGEIVYERKEEGARWGITSTCHCFPRGLVTQVPVSRFWRAA